MKVTIFDYGAGNIHSLAKAIAAFGATVETEANPSLAIETDVLVLPGVGAFGLAAERLAPGRLAMQAALRSGVLAVLELVKSELVQRLGGFQLGAEGDCQRHGIL